MRMVRAFAMLLYLKWLPMRFSLVSSQRRALQKHTISYFTRFHDAGPSTLRPQEQTVRWMTTFVNDDTTRDESPADRNQPSNNNNGGEEPSRRQLLDSQLEKLGVDSEGMFAAALQSIENPTAGYDGNYGKSAIKTYRAFLNPKAQSSEEQQQPGHDKQLIQSRVAAMAQRTAQQIEFLLKRHQSHQTEWIRHHDADSSDGQQDLENRAPPRQQTFPIVLILDNLRSAFNVGSIFRTADAAGVSEIWTTGICPHPGGSGADKVRKSALGAEAVVPTQHFATTVEALAHLRKSQPNMEVLGLETTEKSLLYTDKKYSSTGGVALIFGNEVTGVDTTIMPLLDGLVEIPMFGTKNSLNVASCAPIVLYEVVRQWKLSD